MMLLSRGPKLNRFIELSPLAPTSARPQPFRALYHLAIEQRHAAGPTGGGGMDFYREAAHLESERRQLLKIGELLHVAIADLPAGFVPFPNDAGVAGFGEPLTGERERRVPAPAVGAGDA